MTAKTGLQGELKKLINEDWFKEDYQAWLESGAELDTDDRWYAAFIKRFQGARRAASTAFQQENIEFYNQVVQHKQKKRLNNLGLYEQAQAVGQEPIGQAPMAAEAPSQDFSQYPGGVGDVATPPGLQDLINF